MKKALLILACLPLAISAGAQGLRDTIYMSYPDDCTMKVSLRHDYTKTLVTKLFLAQSMSDGLYKHADNGEQKVFLDFEQALERIKGLDCLSLGMPKITYLVGWQYNGHDSKYPAFFEGNEMLKRDCDANAAESIKWLSAEAKKYNTAVSFHINMFDCYEDSPLFYKYLRSDVLARTKTGHLLASEWGYKVDYAQEWKSGLAKERIDKFCEIFPVQDAGSVHIDAFHTTVPIPVEEADGSFSVTFTKDISPYHGWTRDEEVAAQIEIIKYWDSKGVDVTTEGLDSSVDGLNDPHSGYRAMVWHINPYLHLRYPESMLTGGNVGDDIGKRVFGSNDDLESLLRETPCDWREVTKRLCTSTFISNYINRHERLIYIEGENYGKVVFGDGLVTEVDGDRYTVSENGVLLVENDDILIPALWIEGDNLVAYSANGYKNRTWDLLPVYPRKGKVTIWSVSENGRTMIGRRSYSGGRIRLSLQEGQMLLLSFD